MHNKRPHQDFTALVIASRERLGLTQRDVSNHFGLTSPQFISNIERGLAKVPLTKLGDLCDLLKIQRNAAANILLEESKKELTFYLKGT